MLPARRRPSSTTVRLGRRPVLRALLLGAAAASLAPARAIGCALAEEGSRERTSAKFALRYVLATSLYGKTRIEEILPEVAKTGAEEIDLWPERHANQREQVEAMGREKFAELLRAHGVRLGMTTRFDLGPFRLAGELRAVKKLGGDLVVTGSRGPKGLAGDALRQAVREFVEDMKPHVALAAELGLTIGIENHSSSLVDSPDSIRYLAEHSNSSILGIALAPYHLPQDSAVIARLIEDIAPRLVHFYAWQHGKGCMEKLPKEEELQQLPGRGKLDFKPILAALRKIHYKGRTEIFMHPVPRGVPILETTAKVTDEIQRGRDHLERCLKEMEGSRP